jgi:hypothetical protein
MDVVRNRRVIRQLEEAQPPWRSSAGCRIGVALSAERDINKLLNLILLKS